MSSVDLSRGRVTRPGMLRDAASGRVQATLSVNAKGVAVRPRLKRSPVRSVIRTLDWFLRREQRIFEFSDDPDCLFRARVVRKPHPLKTPEGEIAAGVKVLELHLWNEHVPGPSPGGFDVAWATRLRRMGMHSFHVLAERFGDDPRMVGVRAVGGEARLYFLGKGPGAERLLERLGFALTPHSSPLGVFGEFWENVHSWMIMWAFNPATLPRRSLLRAGRTDFWISAEAFGERYRLPAGVDGVDGVRRETAEVLEGFRSVKR